MRTEEEQIAAIKDWWKENGIKLVAAIVVAAVGYFGYQGWQDKVEQESHAASDLYLELQGAIVSSASVQGSVSEIDLQRIQQVGVIADRLQNEYSDNGYAVLGAISAARAAADRDDYIEAITRLEWALEADNDSSTQQLVTHRIAVAKAALGETDEALRLLSGEDEHFAAVYAESRGDIYRQIGDTEAAKTQYELAIESLLPEQFNYAPSLEFKLNDVSVGLSALSSKAAAQ